MRYLQDSDYKYKISEHDFTTLLQEEDNPVRFVFDAELKSQEVISLFLRKRYDLGVLFQNFPEYVTGRTYSTGQTVWFSSTGKPFDYFLYSPTQTTSTSPFDGDWFLIEPRYPLIMDWMATLSLYKLHERVSPDNIPSHRKFAYDEVMKILRMVQSETLSPDFPEIENRNFNIYITGKTSNGIETLW